MVCGSGAHTSFNMPEQLLLASLDSGRPVVHRVALSAVEMKSVL